MKATVLNPDRISEFEETVETVILTTEEEVPPPPPAENIGEPIQDEEDDSDS